MFFLSLSIKMLPITLAGGLTLEFISSVTDHVRMPSEASTPALAQAILNASAETALTYMDIIQSVLSRI